MVTGNHLVTMFSQLSPTRARAREGAYTPKPGYLPVTGYPPPPVNVTLLRHCRCIDCRKFYQIADMYVCRDLIGGTHVTWTTGKRSCEPPPEAWHYCKGYDGPQISKDVCVWPKAPVANVEVPQ